ncbi:hypothetical protein JZ751_001113 [Albula glossodonta]|uniref:Thyroxine-binding globulin n=1 Tax=Albula glossodonta TaxID=121402 RepID=A0A8T2PST4_9TELE|nr:hypothetical protein JZ751_001113 [Albula glossodonta]
MRVFLSLCVVLVVLWSTVRSQEHSHSHHNHHDERVNGSLIFEENTDFAFRLYKHISALPGSQSQNVFFSPLSISVALSALSMGARGKTHQQLFEGLGFNATDITAEEVSQSFQSILENLNNKTDVDLSLGSTLFVGETFKPLPKFLESMKRYYHADGFSTDFTKTEEAKEQINKYVEEKTKGKITKLVENLDPQTLMYLISYIYFKGISADILQLKYSESVSMLLVLPGKGLQGVEEVVCRVHVAKWLRWMKRIKAKVFIPKFSIKTSYKLNDVLSGMGITDIFEDTAEFSGITDEQKVKVSEVVHQALLDVDESGATAAAATGVGLMPLSFVRYPVLRFDRPFMVIMFTKMRALLSLCVALVVLWSTVLSEDHSHSHGAGHDHHDDHVNNSLRIYEENGNFAFSLYKHISALPGSQSQNVFFSPLSISVALSALSMGTRGKTHQQLFEGLGFNATDITAEEVSQSFQSILENLNNKTEVTVSVGNALFINETFKPFPEFLENMKRYYYSEGFSTDFRKTEEAKEQINKYVEEKTGGKIAKILDEVDPLSVMYLISYIYFKGEWEIPFSSFLTKTEDFHVDDHTTVPVEMMVQERNFPVYHDEAISTHVLQLHYKGSASMLLVLPEKGLQGLEEVVCRKHFRKWMRSLTERTYTVHVPKLSIETSYQLKEVLYGMGITDIFEDADLTGISDERDLLVSKVVHKATLDVNEAGTVATAATGIEITTRSMMFPPPPDLKFDRPFMVFVINHDTRSILFMGKIQRP